MAENDLKISLCISTYNWPSALALCLESVKNQQVLPHEVVIADDGSKKETAILINEVAADFPVPVLHVWQPDEGFRLAQIRNRSFARCSGNYIIQIDGDVILHPSFIKDHRFFARRRTLVCGTRMLLNKEFTDQLLGSGYQRLTGSRHPGSKRYNAFRSLPLSMVTYIFQRGKKQVQFVLGANMAFFKEDILRVNGYNEAFTGWGKEDNEFALRLYNAGVQPRFVKFAAIEYHLYHKESPRETIEENERLLAQTAANKTTFAPQGMNAYMNN